MKNRLGKDGVEETGIRVSRVWSYANEQGRVVWHNASTHGVGRSIKLSDCQVIGDSNAFSNRIYVRDIRIRIFGRAILRRVVREIARSVSTSSMRVCIVV